MTYIVSDNATPYQKFLAETLEILEKEDVKGLAVVALTDSATLTGYWNMSLRDKDRAMLEIHYDCIDGFIKINKKRYFPEDSYED